MCGYGRKIGGDTGAGRWIEPGYGENSLDAGPPNKLSTIIRHRLN
jgi:hypothetical protein